MFGKFSDVARANRLEADLPEVNLPLCYSVRKERSARMAGGICPKHDDCVGSDRSHGIEAVP